MIFHVSFLKSMIYSFAPLSFESRALSNYKKKKIDFKKIIKYLRDIGKRIISELLYVD